MQLNPATLAFLKAVKEENSREFFATVKELYLEIYDTLKELCKELIEEATILDPSYAGLQPKDCLFRIYRDARMLKEWDLIYKENFGMAISPEGKKSQAPGYYLHIEADGGSFFGGGLYWPSSDQLLNLRHYIQEHGDEYIKILDNKELKKVFGPLQWEQLQRPPKWFSQDEKYLDLLKMKQHLFFWYISDKDLIECDILELCKKQMHILSDWMLFLSVGCNYTGWRE